MSEKELKTISALFYFSSAYDFVLGAVFLLVAPWFFRVFVVDPPNHWGYIHFPALLLILFGIMFYQIAENPRAKRNLIPYGCLLKASYCSVVALHTFVGGNMPDMWKPFGIADFLMLLGFLWAYKKLGPEKQALSPDNSGNIAPH
ncbi:MAG TPA: hypothetical protein EYN91_06130 [Candidatus Melainabacteria bacterium]|nr:hypothetical protein [Candidatus Melainabacteria bacterium]HIN64965.1 hypothetical protein [Candidatus Obscuribacterales bacterium]